MTRFVIAAEKTVEDDPHFPVRVWAIDAETKLAALREARRLADQDPLTSQLPARVVDGPERRP